MAPNQTQIAIIGAGIAGMHAGASLAHAGLRVELFEKSRGPGGRTSTRRQDELRFDHGTPHFEGRDPSFIQTLTQWSQAQLIAPWPTQKATLTDQGLQTQDAAPYTAIPKMSALARAIGGQTPCHYATRIASLQPISGGWQLTSTEGHHFEAERVLLTAPPPQSLELLGSHAPQISEALRQVEVLPDWTVMLTGEPNLVQESLGWIDFEGHPCLGRLTAEHKKPGRPQAPAWTLHANGAWSREHEEQDTEWVAQTLVEALSQALGRSLSFSTVKAHRWRYARTRNCASSSFLSDEGAGLYYAGDACLRGDLESAFLSGDAAARALIGSFQA